MTDLIGDIHGHADKLEELLVKLGYTKDKDGYSHPGRTVVFVGDYIDRGPKIPETLSIVKAMVDRGAAIVLMGNHEYNAICFNQKAKTGGYLRAHDIKNFKQHAETLLQFQGRQQDYDDYIDWFRTLPLYYETDQFRAVHATWDKKSIDTLEKRVANQPLTPDLVVDSLIKDSDLYNATETTLKGKEAPLPPGASFKDKDGHTRHDIRIKWWLNPRSQKYKSMSVLDDLTIDDIDFETTDLSYYKEDEKPVFFGHYWLKGEPNLYRGNICCLDWSVAKRGYLAAYRFDGEKELSNNKFVFV